MPSTTEATVLSDLIARAGRRREMSYFAVVREAGPAWTDGEGIAGQPALTEHTAFMDTLADEGFVVFGGPLAGTERGRLRVLLIVDAESEADVHARLANDPWATTRRLEIVSAEPWNVLAGAERLATASQAEQ